MLKKTIGLNELITVLVHSKLIVFSVVLSSVLGGYLYYINQANSYLFESVVSYNHSIKSIYTVNDPYLKVLDIFNSEDFLNEFINENNLVINPNNQKKLSANDLKKRISVYRVYNLQTLNQIKMMYPSTKINLDLKQLFSEGKAIAVFSFEWSDYETGADLLNKLLENLNAKTKSTHINQKEDSFFKPLILADIDIKIFKPNKFRIFVLSIYIGLISICLIIPINYLYRYI